MGTFMDDVQLETPSRHEPHLCFSVQHLVEMEHFVRDAQAYYQQQIAEMAKYRLGIMEHLAYHHGLTNQQIADVLGHITDRRVDQILKGH